LIAHFLHASGVERRRWPATLSIAATFSPELALEWGTAMGDEFWGKGTNIQEGPGVNVARVMRNGRNFEYMSGEDPVLGARMLPPLVHGIQQSVMSITKHYILNNQETGRDGVRPWLDPKQRQCSIAGHRCERDRRRGHAHGALQPTV